VGLAVHVDGYRNAAIIVGATVWRITFETGVLMAYRAAASIAKVLL